MYTKNGYGFKAEKFFIVYSCCPIFWVHYSPVGLPADDEPSGELPVKGGALENGVSLRQPFYRVVQKVV